MQSAKKSTKILSALSMAAAAAVASHATKAHAVTLTMYYGQDTSYANSANGVYVASGYNGSGSGTLASGESSHLIGAAAQTVSQTAATTITVPVGGYLSLALDALVTGNPNSAVGVTNPGDVGAQPSFLGLAELGAYVVSSDITGTLLTPQNGGTTVATTINGLASYGSTAFLNGGATPTVAKLAANGGAAANANSVKPQWAGVHVPGNVQPNLAGFDTAPNSAGGLGTNGAATTPGAYTTGGNTSSTGATPNENIQFSSATNTASYQAATTFADNLVFKALASGTVTLSPTVVQASTEFWTANGTTTTSHATNYAANHFGGADTINQLPVLVIKIGSVTPPGHPIALFTANSAGVNATEPWS